MIEALKPKIVTYQSSIGLKAMTILDRHADLYVAWSRHIKKWDTCAPAAIIKAAGAGNYYHRWRRAQLFGADRTPKTHNGCRGFNR